MAKFEIAYQITKQNEGGYHNGSGDNSNDSGGETFKGIARNRHPNWPGWKLVDQLKHHVGFPNVALNSKEIQRMVHSFYKEVFWDINNLDRVNSQAIANEMFDTGVNMGVSVAAKFLQQSINYLNRGGKNWQNITEDGVIGPVTLGIVNRLSEKDTNYLFDLMNILQGGRYIDIIEKRESQEVFIRGWLERVELMK